MDLTPQHSRRRFLWLLAAFTPLVAFTPGSTWSRMRRRLRVWKHPEPRPGIDALRVLTTDQLDSPGAAELYDGIRAIPEIADGVRCYCGCADLPNYYSLLTCHEEEGMAQWCDICQGEARIVIQLQAEGMTLNQIRGAVDRKFG